MYRLWSSALTVGLALGPPLPAQEDALEGLKQLTAHAQRCSEQGRDAEAIAALRTVAGMLQDKLGGAAALPAQVNLAKALTDAGQLDEGRSLAAAVLAARPERQDVLHAARMVLTDALGRLGDADGALRLAEAAVADLDGRDDLPEQRNWARLNLCVWLARTGRSAPALALEQTLAPAFDAAPAHARAEARLMLAEALLEGGDPGLARTRLEQAIAEAPADTRLAAKIELALAGTLYRLGALDQALARLQPLHESLAAKERPDSELLFALRQTLASAWFSAGQKQRARQLMRQSMLGAQQLSSLLDSGSLRAREAARRTRTRLLSSLLSCRGFDAPDPELDAEDLEAALWLRGNVERQARLAAVIASRTNSNPELAAKRDAWRQAQARALEPHDDAAQRDAEAAAEQLWRAALQLPEAVALTRRLSVREHAQHLRPDSAALVTVRYERYLPVRQGQPQPPAEPRHAAFVLEPGGRVRRVELGLAQDLAQAVDALRQDLTQSGTGPARGDPIERAKKSSGREQLPRLLAPLFAALPADVQSLYICPDAELASVPWEALRLTNGALLADRYAVQYGETLDTLAPRPESQSLPSVLLVGDVEYGPVEADASGQGLRPLPASAHEIAQIEAEFRRRHSSAPLARLQRAAASKDAVTKATASHRYLHVATHGVVRPSQDGSATAAFLAFANANTEGNASLLSADEALALDLAGCELAVLSACSTNVGPRATGDSIVGMNRALRLAGARHTVSSLWNVSDSGAATFFAAFYRNLWSEQATPAQALAHARAHCREQGLGPATWAAFVLYGPAD